MQRYNYLLVGLGCLSALPAQTIGTTFAAGSTSHTSSLTGRPSVSLDMQVLNPAGIVISQIDVLFGMTGRSGRIEVYLTNDNGTYNGFLVNPPAGTWMLRSSGNFTSLGTAVPTPITLDKPIVLPAGNYGLTLVCDNQIPRFYAISAGPPPTQTVFSNADVVLTTGSRQNDAFVSAAAARVPAMQFHYLPATFDVVDFTADVHRGPAPLTVQFTDRSNFVASTVLGYEWDFDGDNVIDSTLQNPTAVYPACGNFSPKLRVLTTSGPVDYQWTDLIQVDPLVANFTATPGLGAPPNLNVQFADTSTGTVVTRLWDFDGDGVPDSAAANPTWSFGPGSHDVTLTVLNGCRTDTITQRVTAATGSFDLGITGAAGNFNTPRSMLTGDLAVLANEPLILVGLDVNALAPNGAEFHAEIYLTQGTWVGKHTQPQQWRLATSGSGICRGANTPSRLQLDRPLLLLPGQSYGIAVHYTDIHSYYFSPGTPLLSNADLAFTTGAAIGTANGVFVNNTLNQPRQLSAIFYYIRQSQFAVGSLNWFANGCAGSRPAARLTPAPGARLMLGSTSNVTATNLPVDAGIAMIGFSRTSSLFGPLPLALDGFGMPGCTAYVSPDATNFVLGANQQANIALTLPNNPAFAGLVLHLQLLALDPGTNAFGAVVSDAVVGLVGAF